MCLQAGVCPAERSRAGPWPGRFCPAACGAAIVVLVAEWRPELTGGACARGCCQSVPDSPVGAALDGFRSFPDQQSLRVPVLPRLGMHPHPVVGGKELAVAAGPRCCHAHGAWLCGLCQFCSARHPAAGLASGTCPALQLAGDACECDHAQLCRPAGGIAAVPGRAVHRSQQCSRVAKQFHRQWGLSPGPAGVSFRYSGF